MKLQQRQFNIVTFNLGNYASKYPILYDRCIENRKKIKLPYQILDEKSDIVQKYINSSFCKYWIKHGIYQYVKDYIQYKIIANDITSPMIFLDMDTMLTIKNQDYFITNVIDSTYNYYRYDIIGTSFLMIFHKDVKFNKIDEYDPSKYIDDIEFMYNAKVDIFSLGELYPEFEFDLEYLDYQHTAWHSNIVFPKWHNDLYEKAKYYNWNIKNENKY